MKKSFRLGILGLACATALAVTEPATALSVQMMRDADLVSISEGAARVKVLGALPAADGDTVTRYLVEIKESLYGGALGKTEVLLLPGTHNAPNLNLVIGGMPVLAKDQSLLLLYRRAADGSLTASELVLGLFFEFDTPIGRVYLRTLDQNPEPAKQRHGEFAAARDAIRFEGWLRGQANGQPASHAYLLDPEWLRTAPKFMLQQFNFGNPNFPIGPGRWFQFDDDEVMPWTAGSVGQANTGGIDEFQLLQQALAAWTNDTGSRILMQLSQPAGTVSNTNDNTGFTGKVTWNRNLADSDCAGSGAPTGAYDCEAGGTLAIGGSFVTSNAQDFEGTSYYPRSKAFICIRNNAGCSLVGNGGLDGAELLAHEVGHTIAFAHSCNDGSAPACNSNATANAAIMRPFLHGNRGPVLGADDQAGAALVYPAPAPANIGPTLTAVDPSNGSNTTLPGGDQGDSVGDSIQFSVSGGSGEGTTRLECTASGAVSITQGGLQTAIPIAGPVAAVLVAAQLGSSQQSGTVNCTATGGVNGQSFQFNFTVPAGTPPSSCNDDTFFRSSFEADEDSCTPG